MRFRRLVVFMTILLTANVVEGGPPSLVGSHESQYKQNDRAEEYGLPVIKDDAELRALKSSGTLVPIPSMVKIDQRLSNEWRWCLVESTYFIGDIGLEFQEIFGRKFQVNSAVRTVRRQLEITYGDKRSPPNGNAAPVSGRRKSSHLTGATIDIAKIGLTKDELNWLREKLLQLEALGKIEATEEQQQAVFHVMVFRNYSEPLSTQELQAQ